MGHLPCSWFIGEKPSMHTDYRASNERYICSWGWLHTFAQYSYFVNNDNIETSDGCFFCWLYLLCIVTAVCSYIYMYIEKRTNIDANNIDNTPF